MARSFDRTATQYLWYNGAVKTDVPLTLACWARPTLSGNAFAYTGISICRITTANSQFSIDVADFAAGNPIRAVAQQNNTTYGIATTSSGYTQNAWQHMAGVFTANNSRDAFLNATGKGSNTTSATPASLARTYIGAWYTYATSGVDSAGLFNGQIAYAAVWSVALTDSEVASLGSLVNSAPCGFHPLLVRPASLLSCWPLGGAHGNSDADRVGAASLTPVGSPTWYESPKAIYPCDCCCA